MAERFKGLATKLDDLSSAPGTFMVKGESESEILQVVLWLLSVCRGTHVPPYMNTHKTGK